jgi:hypothetical protein
MWIGNDIFPVCPPEVPDGLPNLITLSDQIAASREIDVTVIESPPASGKSEHVFMVLTKVNGVPVDAVITSVNAVTESLKGGIGVETPPFDTMAVATGFQSLGIDLSDGLNSTKTILITVEYVDGDNTLQGAILVSAW